MIGFMIASECFTYARMRTRQRAYADAFTTLRDLLVNNNNKKAAAKFLDEEYTTVFTPFLDLMKTSQKYVTKRWGEMCMRKEYETTRKNTIVSSTSMRSSGEGSSSSSSNSSSSSSSSRSNSV